MKVFFLLLFVVSSAVHLYASLKTDKTLRAWSKGFIVSALLGWYCLSVPDVSYIVVAALFFSWLGDMLLIPKGIKWFTAGGISFMASHVCFILAYWPNVDLSVIPPYLATLAAWAYGLTAAMVFRKLKPWLPKPLFYPMFLYLLINGTMNCFAFYQLLSLPCAATVVTFIGAMLFFASDSILFYVRFKKDTRWKTHFPVMLTYIFAEYLIVLGIIMLAR